MLLKTKLNFVRNTLLLLLLTSNMLSAQNVHSYNGDGTYTNPLISADFPGPDVIRVGGTYYMISTTMFIFPGVATLHFSPYGTEYH